MDNLWRDLYDSIKSEDWNKAAESGRRLAAQHIDGEEPARFFDELLQADVLKFFRNLEWVRYAPGQVIMREGVLGESMYILVSGTAEITLKKLESNEMVIPLPPMIIGQLVSNLLNGKSVSVGTFREGTVLGEISLLLNRPHMATVTAKTETELLRITRSDFSAICTEFPQLRALFNDLIIGRLTRALEKLHGSKRAVNTCVSTAVYCKIREAIASDEDTVEKRVTPGESSAVLSPEAAADLKGLLGKLEQEINRKDFSGFIDTYIAIGRVAAEKTVNAYTSRGRSLLKETINHSPVITSVAKTIFNYFNLPYSPEEHSRKDATVAPEPAGKVCIAADDDFLALFEEKIRESLHPAEIHKFRDNAPVISYGESSDSVYVIKSGRAKVMSRSMHLLETLTHGNIFGEFAFITGAPRNATIIADGELEVYELNRNLLIEIIACHPEVMEYLSGIYQQRINEIILGIQASRKECLDSLNGANT